jgi:biopolymer transport protein ExbB
MNKRWNVMSVCVTLFVFSMQLVSFAQDGDGVGEATSFMNLIIDAGPIGWTIILLSLVATALIIEHFLSIQRDQLIPPDLVAEVDRLLQEEQYDEALDLCEMEPTVFTNVVASGITKIGMGVDEIEKSIQETIENERVRLENKISWLNLIGNIAPMMGLLGTVVGMIIAFQQIETTRNPSPSDLAGGIYQALVTTAMGLIVGIPVLAAFFFFRNRVNHLISETGLIVEEIFDQFKM